MPSIAQAKPPSSRLAKPQFNFLSGSPKVSPGNAHEVGSGEVVEHGARLGVLLVFPSQLFTSYRLSLQKNTLVSTECPARDLPCPRSFAGGRLRATTYYPPRFPQCR